MYRATKKCSFWFSAAGVMFLLGAPACGNRSEGVAAGAPAGVPVEKAWTAYRDPLGFSLQLPPGWNVRGDAKSGRAVAQSPDGAEVVIWPVFVPGRLDSAGARPVLRTLASRVAPGIQWSAPQPAGAAAVRTTGRSSSRRGSAIFSWAVSPKGTAGCVYVVSCGAAQFDAQAEVFGKILQSFSALGAPAGAGPPAPSVRYVRWQDPKESAFTTEVPADWRTSGGLFRYAPVDTRGAIEMVSPDGRIRITAGDAEIPKFTEPNQTLQWTGFTEGSWYSPGYGVNMMVRRYLTGLDFAQEYVQTKVARGCGRLSLADARERNDLTDAINRIYAQAGGFMNVSLSAGETAFACGDQRGYYFAATLRTAGQGMGLWNVEYLYGFIAPADKVDLARVVLTHLIETFQINPSWLQMQQNVTAATSKIVAQTGAEISKTINDTYWSRQETMDELSRRRSNVTLGVEDVIDPVSGQELKVESGSSYYWIDHRGNIVGTDTYTKPSIDFRDMILLP